MKKKISLLFPSLLLVGTLFIAGCSSDKRDRPGPYGPSTSQTSSSSTEATSQQGTSQTGTSSTSSHVDPTSQVGTSATPGTSATTAGTSATSSAGVTSGNTGVSTSATSQHTTSATSSGTSQSTSQGTSSTSQVSTSSTSGSTPSVQPTGLTLPYKILTLNEGDVVALKISANPSNASLEGLTWVSSDSSVVSISDGVVTANALGSAVITVTAPNGVSTSVTIYVEEDVDDDLYVPDTTNENIYFITEDTLNNATSVDEEKGEYTFALSDATYEQIYVKVPKTTIVLELSNVTVQNNYNSPIYVSSVDKIEISSKKNTTNTINDQRALLVNEDDAQGKGAIFVSDGDLRLKGAGTLNVTSSYYNGIHGKDDVSIQKTKLTVSAPHHGIRGNDSLTITSGNITVTCGQDGLCTKNSDVSKKGKQRGDIIVNGGTLTINAYGDAIAAAHDVIFEELDGESISYTAKTGSYSGYAGKTVTVKEDVFYLKMSESIYANNTYTYAAYINGEWYPATYDGFIEEKSSSGPGGRPGPGGGGAPQETVTVSYKYVIDKPSGATSFTLYRFVGTSVTSFSLTNYNAKSDAKSFNSSYDMIQVSSISNKTISFGSWSNEDDNATSSKGIKCENEIIINSGTLSLQTKDDGIHANYDGALENGELPLGYVTINGGSISIASDDDGIHADHTLNINSGIVSVTKSYEGLEGTIINVNGGSAKVVASDDGVNARTGQYDSAINVNGGYLDVTVSSSGDTDGIDSNGTFTQTGGICITRGPNQTNMAALDTDGTCQITGGTIIVLGALGEKGLSRGSGVSSYNLSLHSSGNHTVSINGESLTFNNAYSYGRTYCYSSYTVTLG